MTWQTLEGLVDAEDLDQLLDLVTPDQIAESWCRYNGGGADQSMESDWWAVQLFMTTAIFERSELHRGLLLKLAEHANEYALCVVGAGPLEDFVSNDDSDLSWLEQNCLTSPNLRRALRNVWCEPGITLATMVRLDAAAGAQLRRFDS